MGNQVNLRFECVSRDLSVCGNHWKRWCDSVGALGVETYHDGAMDVPVTLNKKKLPTWYRAEIANMGYKESFDYAGRKFTGWCYDLY